jgi:hypothetical protein
MISVPRGENRSFRNVSNELGRLLVMIVPETDEQVDPRLLRRCAARARLAARAPRAAMLPHRR